MGRLIEIGGTQNPDRRGDIILVHGLDGHPQDTWTSNHTKEFWPSWITEDWPTFGVWSLGYDADSTKWLGGRAMSLYDRGINTLDLFSAKGLGEKPICFITHSMGGLLVKQILKQSCTLGDKYQKLKYATKGVIFLATPHSGSGLASITKYLGVLIRRTDATKDLEHHAANLRELNTWYTINVPKLGIKNSVFFETLPTKGFIIVDPGSADLGLTGTIPVPIDADHITIAKLESRKGHVYMHISRFINETLPGQEDRSCRKYETDAFPFAPLDKILFDVYTPDCEEYYIKRNADAELLQILDVSSIWLYGPSGCGKTCTIMRNLSQQHHRHVYICLAAYLGCSAVDLIKFIYCELLEQLGKEPSGNDVVTPTPRVITNISSVLHVEYKTDPVYIHIDEIPLEESTLNEFANLISKLVITHSRLAPDSRVKFLLSSIEEPTQFFKGYKAKIREKIKFMNHGPWNTTDQEKLVARIAPPLQIDLDSDNVVNLLAVAQGSPRFIKAFMRNLVIRRAGPDFFLDRVLRETLAEFGEQ